MTTLTDRLSDAKGASREYRNGYDAALNDCIGLLRKWFWRTNRDARSCEAEMRALQHKDTE